VFEGDFDSGLTLHVATSVALDSVGPVSKLAQERQRLVGHKPVPSGRGRLQFPWCVKVFQ
jgi:hypothetical protein